MKRDSLRIANPECPPAAYEAARDSSDRPTIPREFVSGGVVRRVTLLLILSLAGCLTSQSEAGVVNAWRDNSLPAFEVGKTTRSEVAKRLGPPSQLINLENELIFYYLLEQAKGSGVILIVYNTIRDRVIYDRAIFFFDKQGVLTDYALSLEEAPYTPPPRPKE